MSWRCASLSTALQQQAIRESRLVLESLKIQGLIPSYRTHQRSKQRADRTVELSELYVRKLAEWLESEQRSLAVGDITNRVLEEYLSALGESVSATTVGIHYRTLRAFFGWLEREEEIDRNPFAKMTQPKADDRPVPVFTADELRSLLATTDGRDFTKRRDRAIMLTLIDTGVRLGELLSMSVERIAYDAQLVEIEGKTGTRFVNFGATAWEAVDRYLRARSSHQFVDRPELWISHKGSFGGSGVAQMLKRRGREAGVTDVHPHRFRHTFAHQWLAEGGQENDLVQLAGWTSNQMVARYGRSAAAARAIEAKRANSPGDRL